jgi:hypothetical protein
MIVIVMQHVRLIGHAGKQNTNELHHLPHTLPHWGRGLLQIASMEAPHRNFAGLESTARLY